MAGKRIAYVRVSSDRQNMARQDELLKGHSIDKTFRDMASGKDTKGRPQFEALMDYMREDDEVLVASLDRWGRSLIDIKTTVTEFVDRGVTIRFLKENLTFSRDERDPMANLMLSILGAFAEFEREVIRGRQIEGIKVASKRGVYRERCGRKASLTAEQLEEIRQAVASGERKVNIAERFGVSRETLYKSLREPKNSDGE